MNNVNQLGLARTVLIMSVMLQHLQCISNIYIIQTILQEIPELTVFKTIMLLIHEVLVFVRRKVRSPDVSVIVCVIGS